MWNNITILGVEGDKAGEPIKENILKFLWEKLKMDVDDNEIISAFRLGTRVGKKPRTVVVHCKLSLRSRVFGYTHNLQEMRNARNGFYYVNQQVPEEHAVARKEMQYKFKKIKDLNKVLPVNDRINTGD